MLDVVIRTFSAKFLLIIVLFCPAGCERDSSVSMWIYVFLGNVLRGIGETPVQPLGISFIDDYSQPENAAFYIGNKLQPLSVDVSFYIPIINILMAVLVLI